MPTKEDLTEYSNQELSLRVFNDEGLYRMRRRPVELFQVLSEVFIFDEEQRDVLEADLKADLDEVE